MLLPPRDAVIAGLRRSGALDPVAACHLAVDFRVPGERTLLAWTKSKDREETENPALAAAFSSWFDGFAALFPGLRLQGVDVTLEETVSALDCLGDKEFDLSTAGRTYAATILHALDVGPAPPWGSVDGATLGGLLLFSGDFDVMPPHAIQRGTRGQQTQFLHFRGAAKGFASAAGDVWTHNLVELHVWFEVETRSAHRRAETARILREAEEVDT